MGSALAAYSERPTVARASAAAPRAKISLARFANFCIASKSRGSPPAGQRERSATGSLHRSSIFRSKIPSNNPHLGRYPWCPNRARPRDRLPATACNAPKPKIALKLRLRRHAGDHPESAHSPRKRLSETAQTVAAGPLAERSRPPSAARIDARAPGWFADHSHSQTRPTFAFAAAPRTDSI